MYDNVPADEPRPQQYKSKLINEFMRKRPDGGYEMALTEHRCDDCAPVVACVLHVTPRERECGCVLCCMYRTLEREIAHIIPV